MVLGIWYTLIIAQFLRHKRFLRVKLNCVLMIIKYLDTKALDQTESDRQVAIGIITIPSLILTPNDALRQPNYISTPPPSPRPSTIKNSG